MHAMHAHASSVISAPRAPGWIIHEAPMLHLSVVSASPAVAAGDALVIPAFAGWRAARAPHERGGIRIAPDWVCDVASPESEALDRIVRPATYRAADIPWVWLVDPARRTVEVFAGDGPWWRIAASAIGRGPKRLPPFEGLALDPLSWFKR